MQSTPIVFSVFFLFLNLLNAQNEILSSLNKNLEKGKSGILGKFDSGLQQLHSIVNGNQKYNNKDRQRAMLESSIYLIESDKVLVELIAKKDVSKLETEAKEIGFEKINRFGKIVSGKIDINKINGLTELTELRYARPVYKPITKIGSVDSQGDTALYAEVARTNFNVDGNGLKIGVLSDSYNTLNGEAAAISSGDIPGIGNPNGYTTPVTVLQEYSGTGSDEARGIIELIHDIAPAAQLYARTAFEGEVDFAQGILDLAANGCDVIVDDVGYLTEPFFQDGIVAQAVDSVASTGVLYFSSAGNSGRKSYESEFIDSGYTLGGKPIHDFNPGSGIDYTQEITIPAGVSLNLSFQWDDPFGSLPNSVGSANTDIDVHIYNSSLTLLLTSSTASNITTGDPYEIISYTNNSGVSETVNMVIIRYSGPEPDFIKYVCWTNDVTIDEYDTESSTLVGHPNSVEAIAVGAAAYYNTVAYGASPPAINTFSSAGGTPIFFDKIGNPITTTYRQKPELIGPDGTNTTFFGIDISQDVDDYPNFFGTSASAPSLAGGTLLLMEAGATTREDIIDAFTQTSCDMDDPSTNDFDIGFDYGTGFGMAQVNEAITYFVSLPVELIDFSIHQLEDNSARIVWSTASERDNLGFMIDHRTNNLTFETIATVEGKGYASEINKYEYEIHNLKSGVHYFQLRQEDFDGTITNHGYVSINVYGNEDEIWLSKIGDSHQLIVDSNQNADLNVNVFNVAGRLLMSSRHKVKRREKYYLEIVSPEWGEGIYFYQAQLFGQTNNSAFSGKFRL